MSAYTALLPPLSVDEYEALKADIAERGCLVPIEVDERGEVLDGEHRRRACAELGIDCPRTIRLGLSRQEKRDHARRLNLQRRHLSQKAKRALVDDALRETPKRSNRQLAGALGVDDKTVAAARKRLEDGAEIPHHETRVGTDGIEQPASKPKPRPHVIADTAKDAEEVQQALAGIDPGELPQKRIEAKRAKRIGREKRSSEQAATVPYTGPADIRHGDLRTALDDLEGQVDAIITDPPYSAEFAAEFSAVGELATRLLRPEGVLVAMVGQAHLLAYIERLSEHLTYRWCGAYLTEGPATRVWQAKIGSNWKPILIFDRGDAREFLTQDTFVSAGDDKEFHHWGQDESGIAQLVEGFTKPGDLVVDPFLGGGTTALVSCDLGRRFVGCDVDADAVATTTLRLAA